jgi:hypothetical protein
MAHLGLQESATHLPLNHFALCLDCEGLVAIGLDACPTCAGDNLTPLGRFLETAGGRRLMHVLESLGRPRPRQAMPVRGTRHFVIVARDRHDLYRHFSESIANDDRITVVMDRRQGQRRASPAETGLERRRRDRRWRTINDQLSSVGWAVVRVDAEPPIAPTVELIGQSPATPEPLEVAEARDR